LRSHSAAQRREISRQPLGRTLPAGDAQSGEDHDFEQVTPDVRAPLKSWHINHSSTAPQYVPGVDGMQTLAVLALRELLDNPGRDDWDDLVAANRAL
jgi:hypothetical protein